VADDAEYKKLVGRCWTLFLASRSFLSIKESVTFEGKLMSYPDGAEEVDIGLRFPEPDENGVSHCPGCGEVVRLEEGE